jgi:hypothetical protein
MIYLIITLIILNTAVFLVPKHITSNEMYTSGLFALVIGLITDLFLDLKFDLYDLFNKDIEFKDLLISVGSYASANILFLNFYPFKKGILRKLFHISFWTFLFIIHEICLLYFGLFRYNRWNILYSIFTYPVIFLILLANLKFIRHFLNKK